MSATTKTVDLSSCRFFTTLFIVFTHLQLTYLEGLLATVLLQTVQQP